MAKTRNPRFHGKKLWKKLSNRIAFMALFLFLSVIFLLLIALGIVSVPTGDPDAVSVTALTSISRRIVPSDDEVWEKEDQSMEVLSWEPRAFLYHNFLSREECLYLIKSAKPFMKASYVVDSDTGKRKDSRSRTSFGTFLRRGRDEVVSNIENRIAELTFIPVEHGEGLQILLYEVGQKYDAHFDFFFDNFNIKNGGQRMATVLMYLSDVEEGGETVFPNGHSGSGRGGHNSTVKTNCAEEGLSVKPKMGDALLFWSLNPDAALDHRSLHCGCPVVRGSKWSCTKWLHVEEYKV